jgi:hypothetical protein
MIALELGEKPETEARTCMALSPTVRRRAFDSHSHLSLVNTKLWKEERGGVRTKRPRSPLRRLAGKRLRRPGGSDLPHHTTSVKKNRAHVHLTDHYDLNALLGAVAVIIGGYAMPSLIQKALLACGTIDDGQCKE